MKRFLFSICATALFFAPVCAQTWIGGQGTSWHVAENWSTETVPSSGSNVVIPSGFTVDISSTISVESIQVNSGATLNKSAPMTVSGTVTIASGATMNWNSGFFNGNGSIENNGILNFAGTAGKSISGPTSVNNFSVINFTGDGDLNFTNGLLTNHPAGTMNFNSASDFTFSSSPSELFTNRGTINVETTESNDISVTTVNSGTINAIEGIIEFTDNSNVFEGGVYNVSTGAVIDLSGNTAISGTFTGTLSGELQWKAHFSVAATATFDFSGPAGIKWYNGLLMGSGTLNNNSKIDMAGATSKGISGPTTLSNNGLIVFTGDGGLNFTNGLLVNETSGVINFDSGADFSFSSSPNELFTNHGIVNAQSASENIIPVTTTNDGTFNAISGVLRFTDSQNVFDGGTYNIADGASMDWQGGISVSGTLSGMLSGDLLLNGNLTVPTAATFAFTGDQPVHWNSGFWAGPGTLTSMSILLLDSASNRSLTGGITLNNESEMRFTGTSGLGINNGTLNNQLSGTIDLMNDGTLLSASGSTPHILNNYGLLKKSGPSGTTTFSIVTTTNYGTIEAPAGTLNFAHYFHNETSGIVSGSGTIDIPNSAADFSNNGTFSPGGNPGNLTVLGNFLSTESAKLAVDLLGLDAITEYDRLSVTGNAIFDGSVTVNLGFAPVIGNSFVIATTTGTISQCGLEETANAAFGDSVYTFDVTCENDNQVVLTVSDVQLAVDTFASESKKIILSPNPGTDVIYLRNSGSLQMESGAIIDVTGRLIRTIDFGNAEAVQIPLDGLSEGTYYLKISTAKGNLTLKFVRV